MNLLYTVELDGVSKSKHACPSAECNAELLAIQKDVFAKSMKRLRGELQLANNEIVNLRRELSELRQTASVDLAILDNFVAQKKRKAVADGIAPFGMQPEPFPAGSAPLNSVSMGFGAVVPANSASGQGFGGFSSGQNSNM